MAENEEVLTVMPTVDYGTVATDGANVELEAQGTDLVLSADPKEMVAELNARYATIDPSKSPEEYKVAKNAARVYQKGRTALDNRRKELKADALEFGRQVDAEAKKILEPLKAGEDALKAKIKAVDDEAERVEQERVDGIQAKIDVFRQITTAAPDSNREELEQAQAHLDGIQLDGQFYAEFTEDAELAVFKAREAVEKAIKALDEREAFEAQQAELKRQQDELAEQQAEAARKQEELDKQAREQQEAADKAENDRKAAEQAEADRKAREKREAEEKAQAEQEARERAEREEAERKAIEAARTAMAADKDALIAWGEKIRSLDLPELATDEGRELAGMVRDSIERIIGKMQERL